MSNKYLEKIAKQTEGLSRNQKASIGGATAIGGASLIRNEYHRGNLTGRETLYHGTSHTYKDDILKQGLKPRAKKGIIDTAEGALGQSLNSDNLTFMTRRKSQAHMYANQAERIRNGKFNIHDIGGRIKDLIPSRNSSKGIVEINAPTWKKDEFKKVRNPELKTQFNTINKTPNWFHTKEQKKQMKSQIFNELEKKVFTNKGSVSNKFMKGSGAYTKNSLKEIGEFIKHSPTRFAKGVGRSALGASIIAGGTYFAGKTLKDGK